MKKKVIALVLTGIMGISLMACGQEKKEKPVVQETVEEEPMEEEQEVQKPQEEQEAQTDVPEETQGEENIQEEIKYEDNFSVDSEAVAAFGKRVKEVVAGQDLGALAELAAYPLYVGFKEGGVSVYSAEEFLALGAEKIFTPELLESIAGADENSLSPSNAGFALSSENGPNIIFGVADGRLAIRGMNY